MTVAAALSPVFNRLPTPSSPDPGLRGVVARAIGGDLCAAQFDAAAGRALAAIIATGHTILPPADRSVVHIAAHALARELNGPHTELRPWHIGTMARVAPIIAAVVEAEVTERCAAIFHERAEAIRHRVYQRDRRSAPPSAEALAADEAAIAQAEEDAAAIRALRSGGGPRSNSAFSRGLPSV